MYADPFFKVLSAVVLSVSLGTTSLCGAAPVGEAPGLSSDLKINQIQVLGTHNSYSQGMDPHVAALFESKVGGMMKSYISHMPAEAQALMREEHPNEMSASEMLRYSHPSLKAQLDLGVRSLEIDVNPDPMGGNYSDPVAYRMLRAQGVTDLAPFDKTDLNTPGFKVLHIPDIDFRSNCPTLRLCLRQIREWSDAHPGHVPLYILIEAKVQDVPILPGAKHTVPFSAPIFDQLDQELVDGLGRDKIITPDDVRGDVATLNEAILKGNWPKLSVARGKVLFLLLTANGPGGAAAYLEGHPSLKGRMAFLRSTPGDEHGAFLLVDNALVRQAEIQEWVRQGYLVRTRSDIETFEAKTNDMTRANAAFASGAQIVSTDFEQPGNSYGTPYVVKLPGHSPARCNPVAQPNC